MSSISVYGYDTSMLVDSPQNINNVNHLTPESTLSNEHRTSDRCLLLELPAELRAHIFQHVLPHTVYHASKGICWIKGTTTLLAVSRQIHDEAAHIMYSRSTFEINIIWDCIYFDCQWLLPNGLAPCSKLAFPERISHQYIPLIQNLGISIGVPDNYTRMINKYNHSNGLRSQVESLCHVLRLMPSMKELSIHILDGRNKPSKSYEEILEPLYDLQKAYPTTPFVYLSSHTL